MVAQLSRRPVVQTLPDQVYDILRSQIISYELRPGHPLVEKQLAEALGVSATPVREALLRLEHDGLVVKSRYTGGRVAEISSNSIREVCQVRSVLEGLAAFLCTPQISAEDLTMAAACIDTQMAALLRGDDALAAEQGRRFHALILQKANNLLLRELLEPLTGHIERIRNITYRISSVTKESIAGHRDVLSALTRKDAIAAETAMRRHIITVFDHLTNDAIETALAALCGHVSSTGQLRKEVGSSTRDCAVAAG